LRTDGNNPQDWLLLAKERLEKADPLFAQFGASYSGVGLLQEAIERYLTGFLAAGGWPLERVHDLNRLLEAAMTFDKQFQRFSEMAHSLETARGY
jgi:HEPN domain-containing protein